MQDGVEQDEPEELDFMFDEEMEQMDGRRNTFTDWSDEETDGEIDDHDVNKILIVTQTPPYLRKHPGGDRTGQHTSRAKLTSELVKVINDGLFYYEQDLWDDTYEPEYATIKVRPQFVSEVRSLCEPEVENQAPVFDLCAACIQYFLIFIFHLILLRKLIKQACFFLRTRHTGRLNFKVQNLN